MRTPNGGIIKAAGAGSTGALHTELLGLGLQLPGASAAPAPGAQNHLRGLPGFWAFSGSHHVLRAKGFYTLCRDYRGKIETSLGRKKAGTREQLQLPAKQANFPPNRLQVSKVALVPAPPLPKRRHLSREGKGRARRDGKCVKGGVLGFPRETGQRPRVGPEPAQSQLICQKQRWQPVLGHST